MIGALSVPGWYNRPTVTLGMSRSFNRILSNYALGASVPEPGCISALDNVRLCFGRLGSCQRTGSPTRAQETPIAGGKQNGGQEEHLPGDADPPPDPPALAAANHERQRQVGVGGNPAREEDLDRRCGCHQRGIDVLGCFGVGC